MQWLRNQNIIRATHQHPQSYHHVSSSPPSAYIHRSCFISRSLRRDNEVRRVSRRVAQPLRHNRERVRRAACVNTQPSFLCLLRFVRIVVAHRTHVDELTFSFQIGSQPAAAFLCLFYHAARTAQRVSRRMVHVTRVLLCNLHESASREMQSRARGAAEKDIEHNIRRKTRPVSNAVGENLTRSRAGAGAIDLERESSYRTFTVRPLTQPTEADGQKSPWPRYKLRALPAFGLASIRTRREYITSVTSKWMSRC